MPTPPRPGGVAMATIVSPLIFRGSGSLIVAKLTRRRSNLAL
jgi:hypothetical protein